MIGDDAIEAEPEAFPRLDLFFTAGGGFREDDETHDITCICRKPHFP
jgi:hypothetical protein